jgi:hypothetical protein
MRTVDFLVVLEARGADTHASQRGVEPSKIRLSARTAKGFHYLLCL